jgi:hypothetical protein
MGRNDEEGRNSGIKEAGQITSFLANHLSHGDRNEVL